MPRVPDNERKSSTGVFSWHIGKHSRSSSAASKFNASSSNDKLRGDRVRVTFAMVKVRLTGTDAQKTLSNMTCNWWPLLYDRTPLHTSRPVQAGQPGMKFDGPAALGRRNFPCPLSQRSVPPLRLHYCQPGSLIFPCLKPTRLRLPSLVILQPPGMSAHLDATEVPQLRS
jgi:hypothetical protein